MNTTVGQILVNEALPEELRDYNRRWDGKASQAVFRRLREEYPAEVYRDVAQALTEIGGQVSHHEGSSFSLKDLMAPDIKKRIIPVLQARVEEIANDDRLTADQKDDLIVKEVAKILPKMKDAVQAEGNATGNKLAEYVAANARGNAGQMNQMRGSTLQVLDHTGRPIPVPILNSYADGLDPVETWATMYGVRNGFNRVKGATPKAGYFGKQLSQAMHRLVVSKHDPLEGTGLPVDTEDPDNEGAVLARDYGPFKAGTILTPRHIKTLKEKFPRILVHSPIASIAKGAGIPAVAAGVREHGRMAAPGENVGITAAAAISEPLAQGAISCLAEGTEVRMADLSIKAIEDIQVGDMVLGSDLEGRLTPVVVTRTYDQGIQPCWDFVFMAAGRRLPGSQAFQLLTCSSEHKVLARINPLRHTNGIHRVGELTPSAELRTYTPPDAMDSLTGALSLVLKEDVGFQHVYDIEVDHPDHLFLLANGMIVSNSKHVAGVAGASIRGSSAAGAAGFELVNQLANIPKEFPGSATLAHKDGSISGIQDAPQGGKYVYIGEEKHYVPAGYNLEVKVGSQVEAGDALSEGIASPAEIVKYKGIGEGRRYLAQQMYRTLKDSGIPVHRRNVELAARGLINHVLVTDPDGLDGHLVGDVVEYDDLAARYKPRDDSEELPLATAKGKYLERPVLHYSVGTRITPRVANELKEFGIGKVMTHRDPPPFEAQMERAVDSMANDPDWMTQLAGFNLKKNVLESVHVGAGSKMHSTSYVPSLARAVGFGEGASEEEY